MRLVRAFLLCLIIAAGSAVGDARAQELSNEAFRLLYDEAGVLSLRRTNDLYDTDYIAPNGRLGPLHIRYRTTRNGDWRELPEILIQRRASSSSVAFVSGIRAPALASRASPSAARGVGGLRGLNDGLVPVPTGSPGPIFSWTPGANEPGAGGPGAAGRTRWVQYTFPVEEDVSRIEVFWVDPPESWRLLYERAREWKEVSPRGPYGTAAGAFTTLEFEPVRTLALRIEVIMPDVRRAMSLAEWRVGAEPPVIPSTDVELKHSFELNAEALDWTITVANLTDRIAEISDLAVPLDFAERVAARSDIYTKKLVRHAFVSGHGSWIYWQRSNGEGPYLVMTPIDGTKFEFFQTSGARGRSVYTPYIHARGAAAAAVAAGGSWRLPITDLRLAPKGSPGSAVTYAFRFRWAKDFAGVRDVLVEEGKADTAVVPGMVIPVDLPARVALRTKSAIRTIEPEYPDRTQVQRVGTHGSDSSIYEVHFSRLGENMLTVNYEDGRWTTLEFFVTEPLETLIRKRAAFLVSHHQHTDPEKWYFGVYSDWDQKNEVLRSPEDRDGLSAWLTDANDDAGNARPAFIASKNVFFPDQTEIDSLELYISRYLWGGMQMTETEKYPYAVYGIPNFKANRGSPDAGRNGQAHVWRIYDYPHIVMLYYRMYRIATLYPEKVRYLDAARYLERAYRTAVAYWTVPVAIEKWSADSVGTMNEAFIPELIESLEDEGRRDWADTLRGYWEGKVDRFINRTPNLFGSEFAFDSTGFESTGAFAKYAMERLAPGPIESLKPATAAFRDRVTYGAASKFMEFQLRLNMVVRGWLETTYYQLGSDYRANLTYLLSYMSQMGGWAIVDYGLHFASDPTDYLRLGYASSLSSWALVNSGTRESGYGYWFPGRNNDGATGGGFMPEAIGRAWIGKTVRRGAWHYSAEEDVGYCAALRSHATIVARDPVFGELAYGGVLSRDGAAMRVIPRDGLRVRLHVVRDDQRLHVILDRDGFARETPVVIADDLGRIEFSLENRTRDAHSTGVRVTGLPQGSYDVMVEGRRVSTVRGGRGEQTLTVPISASAPTRIALVRTRQ